MNTYFSQEFTHHQQADRMREADMSRLAKVARGARLQSAPDPRWGGKSRLVLALGGAAAAIIATDEAASWGSPLLLCPAVQQRLGQATYGER